MKCPVCKILTSNKKDICPQCRADLRPHKHLLAIQISNPRATYEQLVAELERDLAEAARKAKEAPAVTSPAAKPKTGGKKKSSGAKGQAAVKASGAGKKSSKIKTKPKAEKGPGFLTVLTRSISQFGCKISTFKAERKARRLEAERLQVELQKELEALAASAEPATPLAAATANTAAESALTSREVHSLTDAAGELDSQETAAEGPSDLLDAFTISLEDALEEARLAAENLADSHNSEEMPEEKEGEPVAAEDETPAEEAAPRETYSPSALNKISPHVAPEVMEFCDDVESFEKQLDALYGDLEVDVEAVNEPKAKPQQSGTFLLDDDLEITIEFDPETEEETLTASAEEEYEVPLEASASEAASADTESVMVGAEEHPELPPSLLSTFPELAADSLGLEEENFEVALVEELLEAESAVVAAEEAFPEPAVLAPDATEAQDSSFETANLFEKMEFDEEINTLASFDDFNISVSADAFESNPEQEAADSEWEKLYLDMESKADGGASEAAPAQAMSESTSESSYSEESAFLEIEKALRNTLSFLQKPLAMDESMAAPTEEVEAVEIAMEVEVPRETISELLSAENAEQTEEISEFLEAQQVDEKGSEQLGSEIFEDSANDADTTFANALEEPDQQASALSFSSEADIVVTIESELDSGGLNELLNEANTELFEEVDQFLGEQETPESADQIATSVGELVSETEQIEAAQDESIVTEPELEVLFELPAEEIATTDAAVNSENEALSEPVPLLFAFPDTEENLLESTETEVAVETAVEEQETESSPELAVDESAEILAPSPLLFAATESAEEPVAFFEPDFMAALEELDELNMPVEHLVSEDVQLDVLPEAELAEALAQAEPQFVDASGSSELEEVAIEIDIADELPIAEQGAKEPYQEIVPNFILIGEPTPSVEVRLLREAQKQMITPLLEYSVVSYPLAPIRKVRRTPHPKLATLDAPAVIELRHEIEGEAIPESVPVLEPEADVMPEEIPPAVFCRTISEDMWAQVYDDLHSLELADEIEFDFAMNELFELKREERFDVLFDLVDEELVDPGRHRSLNTDIIQSNARTVDTAELGRAFTSFKTDVIRTARDVRTSGRKISIYGQRQSRSGERVLNAREHPIVLASASHRCFAACLDLLSCAFITVIVALAVPLVPRNLISKIFTADAAHFFEVLPYAFNYLAAFVGVWFISALFFSAGPSRTFGQKVLKLQLVDSMGNPLSILQAFIWSVSQFATLLTFGLGLLGIFGKSGRAMHDALAEVYVERVG